MQTLTLAASPRTTLGKQVKQLRRAGLVPGNIYGRGINAEPIQVRLKDLERVARQAGESALVNVQVAGEQRGRNVVLRRLTYDGITRMPLHVDLYQVQMDELMLSEVQVQLTGEAPAVQDEDGIVLLLVTHLRVRALPGAMPAAITVDISGLAHLEDAIHVRDLGLPPGAEVLTDPEEMVVKVNSPRVSGAVAEAASAAAPEPAAEERA